MNSCLQYLPVITLEKKKGMEPWSAGSLNITIKHHSDTGNEQFSMKMFNTQQRIIFRDYLR
jgi:hypothetical protein